MGRLEQDNGNGIVEDTLAKDDGVEFGIDFVGVEDGEDGDGIRGGEGGTNREGFDEGDCQSFKWNSRPDVEDDAEDNGGDEGAGEGEGEDTADIAEEVGLTILVSVVHCLHKRMQRYPT